MITSTSNPKVKALKALSKSKERREKGLFIIEGLKEVEKAVIGDYLFDSIYYCPDLVSEELINRLFSQRGISIEQISKKIYDTVAYRENSGGIIACAKVKKHNLNDLKLSDNPLLLVIESVEKPGNLGALLRTADASGIDAVVISDPHTDIFNPNVVRSSIGCLFTVPLATATFEETILWLKQQEIKTFCAALTASTPYHEVNFKQPCAIVMGTESTGLTDEWLKESDQNIIIPMHGAADSMNVSTSAAVLIFEAIRQRSI